MKALSYITSALLLLAACSGPLGNRERCDDAIDNNDDSFIDCQDPRCTDDSFCSAPPAQLSLGSVHSCVLFESGRIRCWGSGEAHQLGFLSGNIGDDETAFFGKDVPLGGAALQIAAGGAHNCALMQGGAVRCWGSGGRGRLGYASSNDVINPSEQGDVNVGGTVTQLSAGGDHTCAILTGGSLRCWGSSFNGQLGYGNTNDIGDDEEPASAGDVNVGGTVIQISAGNSHTCAVLDTGNVRCWGSGFSGKLGYGNTNAIGDDEEPAVAGDVQVGGRVIQVAAGGNHTCALLENGNVRCWGETVQGATGYPGAIFDIGDFELPDSVGDVQVGGPVTQITTGATTSCALVEDGTARCWGTGDFGALGYPSVVQVGADENPSDAGAIDIGAEIVAIETSSGHTCALTTAQTIRCWRIAFSGELGYGNTNNIGDDEPPSVAGDVPLQ